jgi:hypothetical protein
MIKGKIPEKTFKTFIAKRLYGRRKPRHTTRSGVLQ